MNDQTKHTKHCVKLRKHSLGDVGAVNGRHTETEHGHFSGISSAAFSGGGSLIWSCCWNKLIITIAPLRPRASAPSGWHPVSSFSIATSSGICKLHLMWGGAARRVGEEA